MSMPVKTREFFIRQLEEQYKAEKQAYDEAQAKIPNVKGRH